MAVLVSPLLMASVCSTGLEDRTNLCILLYIILTDVMNVPSFLIKGVELLMTGKMAERKAVPYHVSDGQFGEIRMSAAQFPGF